MSTLSISFPREALCISIRSWAWNSLKCGGVMGVKDFPLVLPLVLHGKFIFNRRSLMLKAFLSRVCCHVPFRAHAPIQQMLLPSSVRAGYTADVHSWRKERTTCILKDVKGKSTLQLLRSCDLWAQSEGGGMEHKQVHLNRLKLAGGRDARNRDFPRSEVFLGDEMKTKPIMVT